MPMQMRDAAAILTLGQRFGKSVFLCDLLSSLPFIL
jgi:hypothetical protein